MEELDGCISFWESKLVHDRYLMEPGTMALIETTIRLLKELKKKREQEEAECLKK